MGNVRFVNSLAKFFGAVNVAGDFEVLFGFAFESFGIVFIAKFAGGVVTIFLEPVELAIETAKGVNGGGKLFGVGGELFANVWLEEELGELRGGELNADFGELGGVGGAEVFDEVVLEEVSFHSAVLLVAPIAIATAGFPVGDVALGNCNAVLVERADDFGMGDVVAEHAIHHVANGEWEAGDFAVARFGPRRTRWAGLLGGGWRGRAG